MADEAYYKLRDVLDKMPNGYPATKDGLEIRILKKIFTPEEADITARLKMKMETVEAIAARTGLDPAYLKKMLPQMADKGQIFGVTIGAATIYKLMPFAFGIYEWQLPRLDRELAELVEEYFEREFGEEFHRHGPSIGKVVPVEAEIPHGSVVEPYESLTALINNAKAWAVDECICKKEKALIGQGCGKPIEVCIGLAPIENFFDTFFWGRSITKEEALAVLKKAEDAGLVHMTTNQKQGQIFICNCCGCCCGVLRGINEKGMLHAMAHSNYRAVVDADACTGCGVCVDRCQVKAIDMNGIAAINERCIGCGLCVSACPAEAMKLVRRSPEEIEYVPNDEKDWIQKRSESRGRDDYRELLK
ncbi:MAG: 4Fe-4S binding protein [Spirochaetes bacterium]|nr:4Fe-4S binding protein [Spirochaetota bacterium]